MSGSYSTALRDNHPQNAPDIIRARILTSRRAAQRLADWVGAYAQLQTRHAAELGRLLAKHPVGDAELGTLTHSWQSVTSHIAQAASASDASAGRLRSEVEKPLRTAAAWPDAESVLRSLDTPPSSSEIDAFEQLDQQRLETLKETLARLASIEADRAQHDVQGSEAAARALVEFDPREDVAAFAAQIVSGLAEHAPKSRDARGQRESSRDTGRDLGRDLARDLHGGDARSESSAPSAASRTSSQNTVRRKSSVVFGRNKKETDSASPSVLSKVGSIFGRKKNKNKGASSLSAIDDKPESRTHTQPPDFGLARRTSIHSTQSGGSLAALPQPRMRALDNSASSSPLRAPASPRTRGDSRAASPLSTTATGSSAFVPLNPLIPLKPVSASAVNLSTAPLSGSGAVPATAATQTQPSASPFPLPDQEPQLAQTTGTHKDSLSSIFTTGEAPAPPPARQSSVRLAGGSRPPSMNPAQRQQRVASHLFANLNPARESRSDSLGVQPESDLFTAAPSIPVAANDRPSSMVPPAAAITSSSAMVSSTTSISGAPVAAGSSLDSAPASEAEDALGALRSSGVPATPGSPDQFWTPAQRFPKQFPDQKPPLSSTASLAAPPDLPLAPEGSGLVAVAVESVDSEYHGDALAHSSVFGRALAVVRPPAAAAVPLGTLLADAGAALTPCPLLKQITDLSFEVPSASYAQLQELCTYSIDNALARVPIKVVPLWRIENRTVRLVLTYQLSDLYVGSDTAEIENLVISVRIAGTTKAISAQSKPVATFSREKQRVTWRLPGRQTLTRGVVGGKLLCQCTTEDVGAQPGLIELHARVIDVPNSLLQLRTLSPANEWVGVPTNVVADVTIRRS